MKKKVSIVHKIGRPSLYDSDFHPAFAFKLCSLGMTDSDIAFLFEISEQTVNNWKKQFPQFLGSIKRGKVIADANVAQSLYRQAVGYELPEILTFELQKGEFKKVVETVETVKHYPPDVRACELWLRNRTKFFKVENE